MNTKDLLLTNLSSKGFIYYPEMKRLMSKTETADKSSVCIVEMNDDRKCRVYFSETEISSSNEAFLSDVCMDYVVDSIISYIYKVTTKQSLFLKLTA